MSQELTIALANAAWAEEAGPTLAPVVVTGTRLGTAVLDLSLIHI